MSEQTNDGWMAWAKRLITGGERPAVQQARVTEPEPASSPVVAAVHPPRTFCLVTRIGSREWHSVCGAGEGHPIPSAVGLTKITTGHWVPAKET